MERFKHSHASHYSQIANIVAHYGLGHLVGIFGLERFVPFHQRLLDHSRRAEPYSSDLEYSLPKTLVRLVFKQTDIQIRTK